jgi:trigger factor
LNILPLFYFPALLETHFTTLDGSKRELTLKLTPADLEPHYERAYLAAQPDLQIQGFRKGKVPIAMIKKRFGKSIETDAIEDIASSIFNTVIRDNDIAPIGQPAIKDIQRESDGSLGLTIAYEVLPDFDLQPYRNIEIKRTLYTIPESDVDIEIERLLIKQAEFKEAERVEDELYLVKVRINPIDEATNMPLIGEGSQETFVFLKNEPVGSELKAGLLNTQVGDTFRYTMILPVDAVDNSENARTNSVPFMATVLEIKQVVLPELTDAFVETFTGGDFTTTEDFRRDIERDIRFSVDGMIRESMTNQLLDTILAAYDFEPPQSLVSEVVSSLLQNDIERLPGKKLPKNFDVRRYVEKTTPLAVNTAKWMIIRERIIDAENIEITPEDIERHIEELTNTLNIESTNTEYLRSAIAGDENLKNRLLNEKVLETLLNYSVITDEEYVLGDSL